VELKDKKVLLMGLGILGGGVATARWLAEREADLTVTDMKDEKHLKSSLEKLKDLNIKYVLGKHEEKDFLENEIIVINPDVPANNKYVELARRAGKKIENELTLFYRFCKSKNTVAITGTRGKTTTVNWTYHLLKQKFPDTVIAGNSSENPFLDVLSKIEENTNVVLEVPSYQLELLPESGFSSPIVAITNVYTDHLNRHGDIQNYAEVKSGIFRNQTENNFLILNQENEWAEFFLSKNPRAKVILLSKKEIPTGLFDIKKFVEKWGEHNLENLLIAIKIAELKGLSEEEIKKGIGTLSDIRFRQELVYNKNSLQIYNDTAATSPDATIAAIKRFGKNAIFISGDTDRELDFKGWAKFVKENLNLKNLVLLSGSATEKMKKELNEAVDERDSLEECLNLALEKVGKDGTIVFSPGAKSFEKFKNEFDRGEKFNTLIENI